MFVGTTGQARAIQKIKKAIPAKPEREFYGLCLPGKGPQIGQKWRSDLS
jgi:hypothetical protein